MAQRRLRDDELKTIADEVGASIDPKDPRNVFFSGNEESSGCCRTSTGSTGDTDDLGHAKTKFYGIRVGLCRKDGS